MGDQSLISIGALVSMVASLRQIGLLLFVDSFLHLRGLHLVDLLS